ncbi:MAG: insulinase family protein [Cyclobacteriaceae bacterium]|nr:insulinase family protein [Cyclobacteriaceae bacterium]
MRENEIYTLKNGIRVIHNRVTTTKIVHCGIMLDIGSRDEQPANQGIAHFWEHMAFKGTRKRKAFHIINRLESLGGELNAYTDKEKILFYASLRDEYFERALELLTDITFDSVFPATQIERERQVILEEMAMYLDDPDDSLQDEFDSVVFAGHSLGMNILGTEKTVRAFKRKNFQQFIREHLDTRRVVFSCVGNIPMDRVIKLAEKYLGALPKFSTTKKRTPFKNYKPREVVLPRNVKQARCAIGRPAYAFTDARRSPFYMLSSILGGSGMNSRLNLALREKHGFVYSIGAQYVPFTDTGLFAISFGTEPSQLTKSISLVKQELRKLVDAPLGVKQLASCKEQLLGQIAMAEENNISFMMMMARNLLDQGYVTSLEEIFDRVKNTSALHLQQLASEMFDIEKLSYLIMEPAHGVSA